MKDATQDRCPGCGHFLPLDDTLHYYHCSARVASADEWDMHPVAAFCSERCADRFHGRVNARSLPARNELERESGRRQGE